MADIDDAVKAKLEELFDQEWDEVLVIIETSATKTGQTHDEVIAGLLDRAERKAKPQERVKRSLIRWIGKPWRERENPWDRFKDRVPPPPPRTESKQDDLDEWTPLKPDED
ncbi:MAG: hypothetical protein WD826_03010 [Actinomycetota bacterium]